jgi:hypothetical protein
MTEQFVNPRKEHDVGIDTIMLDREIIRRELQCRVLPLNTLESYEYTVICASYEGSGFFHGIKIATHGKPKAVTSKMAKLL